MNTPILFWKCNCKNYHYVHPVVKNHTECPMCNMKFNKHCLFKPDHKLNQTHLFCDWQLTELGCKPEHHDLMVLLLNQELEFKELSNSVYKNTLLEQNHELQYIIFKLVNRE